MLRACSKLVTLLLLLGVASPAFAQDDDEEKSSDSGSSSEGGSADNEVPDDSWERPPEEEEKPKAEVKAPVVEKVGDGRPWMAGLTLGYGSNMSSGTGGLGADPYGFTAGLFGGYSLDFNLYVGLFFEYYLGSSNEGEAQRTGLMGSTTVSDMQFGVEVGYDFWLGSVILRPSLQWGMSVALYDKTGSAVTSGSVTDMVWGPGIGLYVPIDEWFLGGSVRPMLISGDLTSCLLFGVQGGMRFE